MLACKFKGIRLTIPIENPYTSQGKTSIVISLQWRIQDFPRGGGAPTPQVGVRTYFIGRKLHENERILTPRGARVPGAPLDPPLH